jgi:hypothetical protein
MTTTSDDGSNSDVGGRDDVLRAIQWWDPWDDGVVTDRSDVQVRRIVKAFRRAGRDLGVERDAHGVARYLYRPGVVLVRDEDVPRVVTHLGLDLPVDKAGDETPQQTVGLHALVLPARAHVPSVVADLDDALGVGVATPDHLIHVTPVTWCMAKEPQPRSVDSFDESVVPDNMDGRSGRVVIVDTGTLRDVIAAHSWLEGVTGPPEPPTVGHYTGHGTFIAGIVRTYAPAAEVRVEAVLSVGGAAFETDVVRGLVRALRHAPDVINLSGGTRTRRNLPLLSFEVFWERRLRHLKGTVLVAAAGNDGDRGPFWPAAFPWAVSVGALADDEGSARAGFSNHGSWVDVYALGTDVVNAFPEGTYVYREPPLVGRKEDFPDGLAAWSGTSFAAPMVAGLTVSRMTWSGESARGAVDALLDVARGQAGVGVGARLLRSGDASPTA